VINKGALLSSIERAHRENKAVEANAGANTGMAGFGGVAMRRVLGRMLGEPSIDRLPGK
jgi:hypothetical protein